MSLTPAVDPNTFTNDPSQSPTAPAPAAAPQVQQNPATGEWFLATETGTRYRTAEEAARGIEEKDRLIAQFKSQMNAAQQVFGMQQPQASAPTYLDLMEQSIQTRNPRLFQDAVISDIDRRAEERFQALMAPFAPLLSQTALQSAVEAASNGPKGDPNIANFVRGGGLETFKAEHPELGEVITLAQQTPQLHSKLPGLLRDAYRIASAGVPAATMAPGSRTPSASSNPATPVAGATSSARRDMLLDTPLEQLFGT